MAKDYVGKYVGRYHLIEKLGQGGMAVVFKAYDTRLERDVAIKFIRIGEIAPNYLVEIRKRFEREAKSLAKMDHPNIVHVHDYGEFEGVPYLVMQYLPGGSLKDSVKKPLPYDRAARLLLPVTRALEFAHRLGVIHRDVKPSNILLTKSGEPMLTDFGIAKILGEEGATQLTGTGMGIGTPEYMAPEQWRGQVLPATDIYALGVLFFELLTGKRPYTADTPFAVYDAMMREPLPRASDIVPGLPPEAELVLTKALAREPQDRYESMTALAAALDTLLGFKPEKEEKEEKLSVLGMESVAKTLVELARRSESRGNLEDALDAYRQALAMCAPDSPMAEVIGESIFRLKPRLASTQEEELSEKVTMLTEQEEELPAPERGPTEDTPQALAPAQEIESEDEVATVIDSPDLEQPFAEIEEVKTVVMEAEPSADEVATRIVEPEVEIEPTGEPAPAGRPWWKSWLVWVGAAALVTGVAATILLFTVLNRIGSDADNLVVGSTSTSPADGMVMVYVPEGRFLMGSNVEEDESPYHQVYLDAFWIDRTEVTNVMYAQCVNDGECARPACDFYGNGEYSDSPVVCITWEDADSYCSWAGRRLPTEAEWEKAARGKDGRVYPWGNTEPVGSKVNFCDSTCLKEWADTGVYDGSEIFAAAFSYSEGVSPYGAYNMAGNVWEWVADWYEREYYAVAPVENPQGPEEGNLRVRRGGSFNDISSALRASNRDYGPIGFKANNLGFRCALTP